MNDRQRQNKKLEKYLLKYYSKYYNNIYIINGNIKYKKDEKCELVFCKKKLISNGSIISNNINNQYRNQYVAWTTHHRNQKRIC